MPPNHFVAFESVVILIKCIISQFCKLCARLLRTQKRARDSAVTFQFLQNHFQNSGNYGPEAAQRLPGDFSNWTKYWTEEPHMTNFFFQKTTIGMLDGSMRGKTRQRDRVAKRTQPIEARTQVLTSVARGRIDTR